MPPRIRDWQVPDFEFSDTKKLGWCKEALQDGSSWVEKQCATDDIKRAVELLANGPGADLTAKWSQMGTGDLKRGVREIIETLANIRPFWGYQTDNSAFNDQANMMNKVSKAIYLKYFVDRSLRDALQFGALTGGGFINPYYSRSNFGTGEGVFKFDALGQPDVLPVQLPKNRDFQQAYAVTIAKTTGIAEAHARFPLYQSKLKPFAKQKYLRGGQTGSSVQADRWRMHSIDDSMMEQYTDIFYTYILDLRINEGTEQIEMGQMNTSWAYTVPFIGQSIQRWEDGKLTTRAAVEEDCKLYPQRRLMIHCDAALMYDGPAFDMHGMVPIVPFYLDDWAWEGTGYSLVNKTTMGVQTAIDNLERSIYRVAMSRVNPSLAYNADIMSKESKLTSKQVEGLDPFAPGSSYPVDGDIVDGVLKPPMPQWCYEVPEWVPGETDRLREVLKRILGLDQIQALEKLRGNIQDPEDLLDAEGPVVIGTSRGMERGLRDLGEITKYNILQYMNTPTLMQYVGVDGIAASVFDYQPDKIIPSHLPGEQTQDANGIPMASAASSIDRAKHFAKNLQFFIAPHSLHEIAQRENRLNTLALAKQGGVPIDPETMATLFNLSPQWGTLEGSTVKEKVESFAREQVIFKGEMAHLELSVMPPPPPGTEGGPPPNPSSAPVGRPPTFAQNPKVKQKGLASGGRVVLSTSG